MSHFLAWITRSAIFCRNLLISIYRFPRHRKYWNGIGEVLDGMPLPSLKLISNVIGTPDIAWYLVSGRLSFDDIFDTLKKNDVPLREVNSVLDFGCGCARVTRHLFQLENVSVYGVDIDQKAIDWCQKNLPKGNFQSCGSEPKLDYAASKFNFICGFSIFTHLTTGNVKGWMHELKRVLAPGGYLLFTTMEDALSGSLDNIERKQFLDGLPVVKNSDHNGENLCRAFHPYDFVRDELAEGLTIIDFLPAGAKGNPGQDLYLFRKN